MIVLAGWVRLINASSTLADAVYGAELVVLATPVRAIYALLRDIAPVLSPGTVVTDVASTKTQVINWAENYAILCDFCRWPSHGWKGSLWC